MKYNEPKYIVNQEIKIYEDGTLIISSLPHEFFCNTDRIIIEDEERPWCRTFYEEV